MWCPRDGNAISCRRSMVLCSSFSLLGGLVRQHGSRELSLPAARVLHGACAIVHYRFCQSDRYFKAYLDLLRPPK